MTYPIILASSSPRRVELLKQVGIDPEIRPSEVPEEVDANSPVEELVQRLALKKARASANVFLKSLIIGADTIVCRGKKVYGKPKNFSQAVEMLQSLNGKAHKVITGIAVLEHPGGRFMTGFEETRVFFKTLSDDEIISYVNSGESFDKAGGYGIQGKGALLVKRIEGDYFNVVGLPLQKLNQILANWGINLLYF